MATADAPAGAAEFIYRFYAQQRGKCNGGCGFQTQTRRPRNEARQRIPLQNMCRKVEMMGERRRINLDAAEQRLSGDEFDVKTATAMALIDIAESLRNIYAAMPVERDWR